MSSELQRWAKTTDFPDPIRWGEIEARILAQPGPSSEDIEKEFPKRGPVRRLLMGLLSLLLLLPQGLLVLAAVDGLAVVVAYVVFDRELPGGFDPVLQLLFGAAIVVAVFPVVAMSNGRRDWFALGASGVTALASAGSFLLLAATSVSLDGVWGSLQFMALIAAVGGLLSFVYLLVVAKPGPRIRLRERWRSVSAEEMWMRDTRAEVLEQLRKRGIVNDADSTAIVKLPVGTWHELESLPDGRVIRNL